MAQICLIKAAIERTRTMLSDVLRTCDDKTLYLINASFSHCHDCLGIVRPFGDGVHAQTFGQVDDGVNHHDINEGVFLLTITLTSIVRTHAGNSFSYEYEV